MPISLSQLLQNRWDPIPQVHYLDALPPWLIKTRQSLSAESLHTLSSLSREAPHFNDKGCLAARSPTVGDVITPGLTSVLSWHDGEENITKVARMLIRDDLTEQRRLPRDCGTLPSQIMGVEAVGHGKLGGTLFTASGWQAS